MHGVEWVDHDPLDDPVHRAVRERVVRRAAEPHRGLQREELRDGDECDGAQAVVDAELSRLTARLPELDERAAREVAATVSRVVDKLLHTPTVRVKELAALPAGESYDEVLRELFALDPAAAEAVARADVVVEDEQ